MATGYTATLDDTEKKTSEWIKDDLVRNFGICVMLRDDEFGLTSDEILAKLESRSDNSYHIKAQKDSECEFLKLEALSFEGWEEMMEKANDKINVDNEISRQKALRKKELHARTERELFKVIDNTKDEITQNVCNFGLQQLDLVKDECEPYLSPLHDNVLVYKTDNLERTVKSIEYHKSNMKKDNEREKGRIDAFLTLIKEVDKILG